jgi:hypothetical protein
MSRRARPDHVFGGWEADHESDRDMHMARQTSSQRQRRKRHKGRRAHRQKVSRPNSPAEQKEEQKTEAEASPSLEMRLNQQAASSASFEPSAETVLPSCSFVSTTDALDSSLASLWEDSKGDDGELEEDVGGGVEGISNEEADYETFSIKCGWRRFVKISGLERTRFLEAVASTTAHMTRLSADMLIFANFYCLRALESGRPLPENFGSESFFYTVGASLSTSRGKVKSFQDSFMESCRRRFLSMRRGHQLATRDKRTHQLHELSKQLATATKNHFATNVYPRMKKWVTLKLGKIDATMATQDRKEVVKAIMNDLAGKER